MKTKTDDYLIDNKEVVNPSAAGQYYVAGRHDSLGQDVA